VVLARYGALIAEKEMQLQSKSPVEAHLQFTIESRQLTSQWSKRPPAHAETARTMIEAASPDDAISEFVRQSDSELVSLSKPVEGRESIATVKKQDSVFLVRVYAA
jgi:hypothetical protein